MTEDADVTVIVGPTEPGKCWDCGAELERLGFYVITETKRPGGDPMGVWHQCPKCQRDYAFYDGIWHSLGAPALQ
jgi:hypothetical protein